MGTPLLFVLSATLCLVGAATAPPDKPHLPDLPHSGSSGQSSYRNKPQFADSIHGGSTEQENTTDGGSDRAPYTYHVIKNSFFLCEDPEKRGRYPHHQLSDDDMLIILEQKGGKFLSDFMATNMADAKRQFKNLVTRQFSFQNAIPKNSTIGLKQAAIVEEDLPKSGQKTKTNSREESKSEADLQPPGTLSDNTISDGNISDGTISDGTLSDDTISDINISDDTISDGTISDGTISDGTISDDHTGAETQLETCIQRGDRTIENTHLYLCTTCSATTIMPNNYWPPIVNEAVCIAQDPYCFIANGVPHGMCRQQAITIRVLRRNAGYCELALLNNQIVTVEDWTPMDYYVKVGCECVINVYSEFAKYVGKYDQKAP